MSEFSVVEELKSQRRDHEREMSAAETNAERSRETMQKDLDRAAYHGTAIARIGEAIDKLEQSKP